MQLDFDLQTLDAPSAAANTVYNALAGSQTLLELGTCDTSSPKDEA
jgi:hypothetical protein